MWWALGCNWEPTASCLWVMSGALQHWRRGLPWWCLHLQSLSSNDSITEDNTKPGRQLAEHHNHSKQKHRNIKKRCSQLVVPGAAWLTSTRGTSPFLT
ncbi:hypothetical protein E2C01_093523 [Portunus trituberculatus]|uniref:Secreted protein n=1 Tax=Portunus trituberculatus TaxID=210409 RepID=A0A5B7JMY3_PORTR|nr:hypothetical protein [Portunus trituberculatus]